MSARRRRRPRIMPRRRPRFPVSDFQLEFNYAVPTPLKRAQKPTGCIRFDGDERKWREKAVALCWVELGIDHPRLAWPTPTCGTPLCLNLPHLAWESPKRLEYPSGVCVYCGLIAGTKDHLLPRTWTGAAVRKKVLTVPACAECNSVISDRYAPSITERRRIAHAIIYKRKKRLMNMPDWNQGDIEKLGSTLRSTIERGLHDRNVARARLAWPEDADYDVRAMQLSGIDNPYEIGLLENPNELVRGAA